MSKVKKQGVGARLLRREDERHLHGRANYIGNMKMPDLQEVAFLRSPVAHGEMTSVSIAEDIKDQVVLREQMDCSDIIADSKLPTYQASTMPPLAKSKVRYVGEPVA